MDLHYFDDEVRPDIEGPLKHGILGFNHCGTTRNLDYLYQAEMWLEEVKDLNPAVVRAELHAGKMVVRRWRLENGQWVVVDGKQIL
jgi:hypothetical protein